MRDFHVSGRSAVYAANGICATSHPLAASAAVDVLKAGGNAVDAAIAGAVLLGICEPQMTGIGGDMFALIKPAGSDVIHALNGSGRAPAGSDAAKLRAAGHQEIPSSSAAAVTVPGAVDGFCTLSERFGKLGLAASLAPAIDYAEAGVPVAPRVAFDWRVAADNLQGGARTRFLNDDQPLRPGETFRAPDQVPVLRRIAELGRDGFYAGPVAEDMVTSLRAAGGVHTLDDFAAQRSDWTDPIRAEYRSTEIIEHPPNGQGAAALLLARVLSRFDIGTMDPLGAARVHLEAEATKLIYDARNRLLADPEAMADPGALHADSLADDLAGRLHHAVPSTTRLPGAPHRDTVYITVVDRDRMAVSLIYSIFHSFGSGIASDRYGILFHNRGAGFTLEDGHPNEYGPGKRPLHTIIPGMLSQDGRVIMPFGVMGGQYQATGHARFVSNLIDFGMEPQAAIDAPRAFATDGVLQVERGYSEDVRTELAELGHKVVVPDGPIGGAQAIWIDEENGVLIGASDPRKDGAAIGY